MGFLIHKIAPIMETNNMKKQTENTANTVPNLTDAEEVRKAVIAAEILQRKWWSAELKIKN